MADIEKPLSRRKLTAKAKVGENLRLYDELMNSKPRFKSDQEAVIGLTEDLKKLATAHGMSVEELLKEAQEKRRETHHFKALQLERAIGHHKHR